MPNLDWDLGLASNLENFSERFVETVSFAALMRGVDSAVLPRNNVIDLVRNDRLICKIISRFLYSRRQI